MPRLSNHVEPCALRVKRQGTEQMIDRPRGQVQPDTAFKDAFMKIDEVGDGWRSLVARARKLMMSGAGARKSRKFGAIG